MFHTSIYDPHAHGGFPDQDQPERSRMVDGTEYLTVSEYLRRHEPHEYPVVNELISRSGFDRTYVVLGKMTAEEGRAQNVDPVPMQHPDYGTVNGWPARIIERAWTKFSMRYDITWTARDPEPVLPSVNARGDDRWNLAWRMVYEIRPNETPEQALVRRTSAAGAMFAIEKEYEGR